MVGDMEYWKVLDYSRAKARVYYVGVNNSVAEIVTFVKEKGNWNQTNVETVWSVYGNADNTIWPYWWHFFYSHPRL